MNTKTALVMAGGTGGHIFPGIAIAGALRARGWRVVWLGNPDGMEARLVPPRGFEVEWLRFDALRGKGLLRKLLLPFKLLVACARARKVLARVRPDVVLGMGGYISFPAGLMAALTRRPLVLHEQNAIAGLSNRVLARLASCVLTGFPDVLPGARWVGNPVREEILSLPTPAVRLAHCGGPLKLLVLGGSRGAAALNEIVPQALAKIPAEIRPRVVHQAGESQIESLRAAYIAAGVTGELFPFIDDMASAYADADIVLCRAGALTIAELAAAGVASVLVPYPHAVDDHQTINARFLAEREAAWFVPQAVFSPEKLVDILNHAAAARGYLRRMADSARALARPRATDDVADVCETFVTKGRA
ncbi:MAG: undecaprenyldiphospho-muramoylpentapeptide beta-N-acetylglucosaminyltransferase [Azoarcus sp.]|jgi:UDP-N-acetylglucosamine--N-acetylmuramyl-(pentapeptide) pyrophosphoryl-undecaprenol N-acetylglucosamine transferase|nr:undecaprenyldiphospho-muramoylpentapeptide beta-N-acetylglucosaminyltransferase [Azoarcus sp.]